MPVASALSAARDRAAQALHPPDRQPEEDRRAGDRAQQEDVARRRTLDVRVRLTRARAGNIDAMAQGHSVDEYLETIYFLAFPIGEYTPRGAGSPPLASRVAEMLHVSRASAGEMLKRLEAEGLIERGARKEALLTAHGPRARRARRPQAPDDRAAADRLHGLHRRRGARARRRARRHVRRRHDRPHRREARPSRALPARLAGRPGARAGGEPRPRAARRARARERARRSSASPSTTATCCTGSTTTGSCPARSSSCARPSRPPTSSPSRLDGGEHAISREGRSGLFVRAA